MELLLKLPFDLSLLFQLIDFLLFLQFVYRLFEFSLQTSSFCTKFGTEGFLPQFRYLAFDVLTRLISQRGNFLFDSLLFFCEILLHSRLDYLSFFIKRFLFNLLSLVVFFFGLAFKFLLFSLKTIILQCLSILKSLLHFVLELLLLLLVKNLLFTFRLYLNFVSYLFFQVIKLFFSFLLYLLQLTLLLLL